MGAETDWSAVADSVYRDFVEDERREKAQQHLEELQEEIARLRAEVEAVRVDAERYRWLRDQPWRDNEELEPVICLQLNALWDDKIDAAMGASA